MEINSVASFLEYYEKVRFRTVQVLKVIPEAHFDWAYAEGKFSIADQMRHIAAIERYMFAEAIAGNPQAYRGCDKTYGESLDEVWVFFNRVHQESMAIFRGLKDEDLHNKCLTPGGATISVWKWLRAMVEHEIHHRGQIYIYLNILGIKTPPMFGLSSEEVQALGIAAGSLDSPLN